MIKAHIIIIILNEDFICMFLDQENCTEETTDDDTGNIKANFKGKQVSERNKMVPFMSNVFNTLYHLYYFTLNSRNDS